MPYKCVHCSKVYEDGSNNILEGCDNCKSKFFFYVKEEQLKKMSMQAENLIELSTSEKEQVERDVREIAGIDDEDAPIFLDFESVKIIKPGKYLIDIGNLFATDKPRVYKLEDGKYIVDLTSGKKERV